MSNPLFPLGQIVSTPGALDALTQEGSKGLELLSRHGSGDWGDLCDDDKHENELSVKEGFRILSEDERSVESSILQSRNEPESRF